ncbi:unnamed protein product [Prorocentrum cordatum]|uniref:Uncharacterized protein n=1 Tax=Prorocentrum cordatum TaxID=2364126 RepID=A0ABN9PJQ8_9DINO|nr:unnamed protein product [Polarella glacialis]
MAPTHELHLEAGIDPEQCFCCARLVLVLPSIVFAPPSVQDVLETKTAHEIAKAPFRSNPASKAENAYSVPPHKAIHTPSATSAARLGMEGAWAAPSLAADMACRSWTERGAA